MDSRSNPQGITVPPPLQARKRQRPTDIHDKENVKRSFVNVDALSSQTSISKTQFNDTDDRLPEKLSVLSLMYQAMQTVVSVLRQRGKSIWWSELRPGVEQYTKRTFSLSALRTIAFLLPKEVSLSFVPRTKISNSLNQPQSNERDDPKIDGYDILVKFESMFATPQDGRQAFKAVLHQVWNAHLSKVLDSNQSSNHEKDWLADAEAALVLKQCALEPPDRRARSASSILSGKEADEPVQTVERTGGNVDWKAKTEVEASLAGKISERGTSASPNATENVTATLDQEASGANKDLAGLPDWLIQKVRQRGIIVEQKASVENKERVRETNIRQSLPQIWSHIFTLHKSSGKTSFPINDLDRSLRSSCSQSVIAENLETKVMSIAAVAPGSIKLVRSLTGKVLIKLRSPLNYSQVRIQLEREAQRQ